MTLEKCQFWFFKAMSENCLNFYFKKKGGGAYENHPWYSIFSKEKKFGSQA
jgi:hypothetical protein